MQHLGILPTYSLLVFFFACNPRGAQGDPSRRAHEGGNQTPTTTSAELDSTRAAFSQAFAKKDSTAFDSLFLGNAAIDMAGMDPEPLRGASGVRVFANRVGSDKAKAGPRFTPDSVQLQGSNPRESGQWTWSSGSQRTQGSYTIVWGRDPNGRLRLAEYRFTMR
jgi:hypothetical protein